MLKIIPKRGERIAQTLRRFNRLRQREGVIQEMKSHLEFETPSQKKRRSRLRSIMRIRKELGLLPAQGKRPKRKKQRSKSVEVSTTT